jgi:ABC-type Fe3+ transport system permease subunit
LVSGVLLVFAVLVLLYRRFLAPFVNMGRCSWRRSARPWRSTSPASRCRCFVLIGILMLFGIVAKNSILLVDFAVEMMNHGMPKERSDLGSRAQARPADRDDHRGNGRGHAADAISLSGDNSWRAPMGITVIGG